VRAKTREQQQSQNPALEQLTPWKPGYFPKVSKPLVQVKGMFFHVRTTDPHRNITGMGYMSKKQQLFFLLKEANITQKSNCQHPLDHRKSKKNPEKHLLLLH